MSARPAGAGRPGTAGRKGMAVTEDDRRRAAMEVLERQILSIGRDVATLSADTLERLGAMLDVHAAELRAARLGSLRSEEHTSELQSLMRISYAVFCLKNKN